MDQKQRLNTRTLLALAGIGAFCAVTIFVAIAILFIRADDQNNASPPPVAVVVGGQTVILYPNPDMSVRIVSGQPESAGDAATATALATAQIGTGGQATTIPPQIATLPAPLPTPTPWPPSVVFVNYVVVPGDTLYRLTQKYNTSIDLMASYNIASANIVVGNTLVLPVANPAFCPGSQPHVVRDQQTVSDIARAYGTTPQAIAAINGLDANYSVKTTQVLCVPY